jgi:hypothetical protein
MKYTIEMIRGTSLMQQVSLSENEMPYILDDNESVHFGVKDARTYSKLLIEATIP